MNGRLADLVRMLKGDDEEAIAVIVMCNAYVAGTATPEQRQEFITLHPAINLRTLQVIEEFTNRAGEFNLDHIAWQLGIDISAEGPQAEVAVPDHACVEEELIYDSHIAAPGYGIAMHCGRCNKRWVKVGDTFYEADAGPIELTLFDVL